MQTKLLNLAAISTLGLGLLAGCSHNSPDEISTRGQDFTPPGARTSVARIDDAQSAKGAVADAMFYDQHFDGPALNSLGKTKLDLMLRAIPVDQTVTVYLPSAKGDAATSRQTAITQYLKDAGVDEKSIQIVMGPNPHMMTPSAYNLSEIYKNEGGTYTGAPADENAASSSAGGTGGSASSSSK